MSTTGPSHFTEVSGVAFTPTSGSAVNIFSVSSINISRDRTVIKGTDNTKQRPVSAYQVAANDVVTIETEDGAALQSLQSSTGVGQLVFTWVASTNQLTSGALGNKTVTISGLYLDSAGIGAISKSLGKGTIKGFLMEQSAGADPVAIT